MKNKFSILSIVLILLCKASFTSAQDFTRSSLVYPHITLSNLVIDKISRSKIIYSFEIFNPTKNSIRLEDIQIMTEIGVPSQTNQEFIQFEHDFHVILDAPLSDQIYSVRNNTGIIVPGQYKSVKVGVDYGECQALIEDCFILKIVVEEYPNPMALPNYSIQKKIRKNGRSCNP
ncbi:MAG: hypothetical protein IPO62_17380 [Saprospiraceae bacterium]|nr:hypothetical protein [Saprospiraceae bacterium]